MHRQQPGSCFTWCADRQQFLSPCVGKSASELFCGRWNMQGLEPCQPPPAPIEVRLLLDGCSCLQCMLDRWRLNS
jgi:hypothetical protein